MSGSEYNYLYETSPRKIEPEYTPTRKRNTQKNIKQKNINKANKKNTPKQGNIQDVKKHFVKIFYIIIAFLLLLLVAYRYSVITEVFNRKENLKKQLALIEKENEQLQVNIENNLNLNVVEQNAKELLGMQKLDSSQKKYVTLPKQDYVEAATEEVIIEKTEQNLLEIIKNRLLGIE